LEGGIERETVALGEPDIGRGGAGDQDAGDAEARGAAQIFPLPRADRAGLVVKTIDVSYCCVGWMRRRAAR